MTHHSKAIVLHGMSHFGGTDPVGNFLPDSGIVLKRARNLKKRDSTAVEDVCDFRHRTRLTIGQPLSGHFRTVAQAVKPVVVNGCRGRKVQNDDRHLGSPDHREHGRRESVRCDVQKDEVNVSAPEFVTRGQSLLRCVDQSQIHDLGAGPFELPGNLLSIPFQAMFKAGKLRPVSVQADSKEPDLGLGVCSGLVH